jgi:hypothetical protein
MNFKSIVSALGLLGITAGYSQQLVLTPLEQTLWEQHREDIETHSRFIYEELSYQTANTYVIPTLKKSKVNQYLQYKEQRKYLCNYKQYEHLSDRVKEKNEIDSIYLDSIFTVLVPYNPQMAGRAISLSLFFAEELALSQEDINVLTTSAVDFARRLHKNPCAYFVVDEMLILKQVLSNKQLKDVLEEKNSKEAKVKSVQAWNALKTAGLTCDLDSINDIGRAYLYYRSELCIKDYHVDNKELLENNLTDLYRHKPRIVQMYEALWQKKQIQKKYERKVSSEYSW